MRSAIVDVLPSRVRRSLVKLGQDLSIARRRRRLTVKMMTERMSVSKATYLRAEKGDPTVALAVYAMALFVLGFGEAFGQLADQKRDEIGLLLGEEQLPKRVRVKRGSP